MHRAVLLQQLSEDWALFAYYFFNYFLVACLYEQLSTLRLFLFDFAVVLQLMYACSSWSSHSAIVTIEGESWQRCLFIQGTCVHSSVHTDPLPQSGCEITAVDLALATERVWELPLGPGNGPRLDLGNHRRW